MSAHRVPDSQKKQVYGAAGFDVHGNESRVYPSAFGQALSPQDTPKPRAQPQPQPGPRPRPPPDQQPQEGYQGQLGSSLPQQAVRTTHPSSHQTVSASHQGSRGTLQYQRGTYPAADSRPRVSTTGQTYPSVSNQQAQHGYSTPLTSGPYVQNPTYSTSVPLIHGNRALTYHQDACVPASVPGAIADSQRMQVAARGSTSHRTPLVYQTTGPDASSQRAGHQNPNLFVPDHVRRVTTEQGGGRTSTYQQNPFTNAQLGRSPTHAAVDHLTTSVGHRGGQSGSRTLDSQTISIGGSRESADNDPGSGANPASIHARGGVQNIPFRARRPSDAPQPGITGGEDDGVGKGGPRGPPVDQSALTQRPQAFPKTIIHPEYQMRKDGKAFFKPGRVFMAQHTEPAGETTGSIFSSSSVFTAPSGEPYYCGYKRFIVVREVPKERFCYCLMITTYSGRAARKSITDASTHAIAYSTNTPPAATAGEKMHKAAIKVNLKNAAEKFDPLSRINFSKVYLKEQNIKVKDLGKVDDRSVPHLIGYYKYHQSEVSASGGRH